jgi:hypothetical protein
MSSNSIVNSIASKNAVTDDDVLVLRRTLYADGRITEADASLLFDINDKCPSHMLAWTQFFTEAVSDFLVHQVQPSGYIDEANANWLMKHIDADGKLESWNELELLIQVIEKAKSVPDSLNIYALSQVKQAVLTGDGVTRSGKPLEAGAVSEDDVRLLRRILYAFGSGGNIGITTAEAEVLFDINDATAKADNHPSWSVLFAQAIANHLMMAQGYHAPDRETALRQEKWLDEKPEMSDFVSAMVKGLRDVYKNSWRDDSGEAAARKRRLAMEAAAGQSEKITSAEANWLASRINSDGNMSPAERAALTFIKQESPDVDPALKPLLDLVA